MFDQIGKKIKTLAKAVAWIGIMLSFLVGAALMFNSSGLSLVIVPVGSLLSWLGSLLLYGFGELVDCAQRIADRMDAPEEGIAPPPHGGWTCPHCGTKNLLGDPKCKSCGKS